ncbi:hypothetical protein EMCRGX_G002543 [Ephydatia muelleri]
MITTPVRVYVTPLKHSNTGANYLGVRTLRLHKSTCAFVSGRLFHANEKGDMEVVCKNGVTLVLTLQLSYNTEIRL